MNNDKHDPFGDSTSKPQPLRKPDEEPTRKPHVALRILAMVVGAGILISQIMLFGNEEGGPRFTIGGVVLAIVFIGAGITGKGLSK